MNSGTWKSWTPATNEKYEHCQIPRVEIDKARSKISSQVSPQNRLDGPPNPSWNKDPVEGIHLELKRCNGGAAGVVAKQHDGKDYVPEEDTEDEEDYGLRSFFRELSWYKCTEIMLAPLIKNINVSRLIKLFIAFLVFIFYVAYFVAVLLIQADAQQEDYWCRGDGFLIIVNSLALTFAAYFLALKPLLGKKLSKFIKWIYTKSSECKIIRNLLKKWYVKLSVYSILIASIVIFLVVDSGADKSRLISLLGIVVIILFGFLFSVAPRKVIWRQVLWGIGLQFLMGIITLRWSVGREIFACFGHKVTAFLKFTDEGSEFVFGKLVSELHIFAFEVLSTILFFSFCIQILFYYGVMFWIVLKLGWLLQTVIGTTACESVSAAANVFVGQCEAPLLIKPFLTRMTRSELHAVMTGGFSTIQGAILAAYISFGIDPAHLITASVMSAPAALGFAKLFYPETRKSKTKAKDIHLTKSTEVNVLHAACEGVLTAIPLLANIAANLIAFIAAIALVDSILNWSCSLVNVEDGTCNLSNIFGYVFMPLAWIMGVPWQDCYFVGQLIGTKTFINEFVAYLQLLEHTKKNEISKRAEMIATYALCGASNLSSIGIQLGGLGAIAPEKRGDLAKVALRAMISGTIACFLTACVAGCLVTV